MGKDKHETSLVSQSLIYIGPLPTSSEFAGYEKTLTSAADRMLTITENEAKQCHNLQNESVKISKKGQWFAFIISLLSLGIIGISMFLGQPLDAIAPTVVTLVSRAAIFVKKQLVFPSHAAPVGGGLSSPCWRLILHSPRSRVRAKFSASALFYFASMLCIVLTNSFSMSVSVLIYTSPSYNY
jgi:uncharacterized membrane protein